MVGPKVRLDDLTITTPNNIMTQRITAALLKEAKNIEFQNKIQILQDKLIDFLLDKIIQSETYASLAGGILRAEFGLDDYEVSNLPYVINDILKVSTKLVYRLNSFKIIINFIDDELDLGTTGVYTSVNKKGETHIIPWLEWLLLRNTETVVNDHVMVLRPGKGRSEMAIMLKPKSGGSYSIDGYFAGEAVDNWITRVIRGHIREIEQIIKDTLGNAA